MPKSILPHFASSVLALVFLYCVRIGHPFLFLPVLAGFNVLNLIYGEFTEPEIRRLLQFYHETKTARIIKIINALVLAGVFVLLFVYWNQAPRTTGQTIGVGFLFGIVSGCFLVTLAHELLHGHTKTERGMAGLLLLLAGMPYFTTDHLLGHHRYIGLREDKTTARLGQHFYHYFFRSLGSRWWHSYIAPWPMPPALREKVVRSSRLMLVFNVALVGLIAVVARQPGILLGLYFMQCFIASLLYELINYIQHYGLERSTEAAPVHAEHSWNCYFKYTNYILFLLPLHSQHHIHYRPGRESSLMGPRMPYVYFVMVLMALVPPWWFRKMNPMVRLVRLQSRASKQRALSTSKKTSSWSKLAG